MVILASILHHCRITSLCSQPLSQLREEPLKTFLILNLLIKLEAQGYAVLVTTLSYKKSILGGGSQPPPSSPGGDRTAGPSSTIPDTPSSNSNNSSSNSNSNSSSNNNNKNNGGSGAAGTESIGIPKVIKSYA
jgi:hypothetical protein